MDTGLSLFPKGDLQRAVLEIMDAALKAADPYMVVKNSLSFDGEWLIVKGKKFRVSGKIYLLAFGKAACAMAKAAYEVLGERIAEGLIVTKYGYAANCVDDPKITVIGAGHPVPDENSMRGALAGVELAEKVGEDDLLLVLISGGGSALFTLPEDGISLDDKASFEERGEDL